MLQELEEVFLEYFIRKREQNVNYFLLVDISFHKDLQPKLRL